MPEAPAGDLGRPIRVVVFTGGPALESGVRKLAARLEDHPEVELLSILAEAPDRGRGAVLRDLYRRRGILAGPLLLQRTLRTLASFLSAPRAQVRLARRLRQLQERVRPVADLHAHDVLEQVRSAAPDLGLIYGGPLLKPALFEIPRFGTLGIHHGKVPEYRGKKTTFWAIFNGEKSAGVTIQRVNAALDRGEVVLSGEVEIRRRTPGAVWRRLEVLGLDLYLQAVLAVKRGTASFRPQPAGGGRLYRDPRPSDIVAFWRRYLMRVLRG